MGLMDTINEQMYILFSMYYYEVFVYKGKIQVGKFIQLVSYNSSFFVDFSRKKAWAIIEGSCFVKGHKLIAHCDLDNAIPLMEIEEEEIKEINENIIETVKKTKLVGKVTKEEKKKSEPKLINQYNFAPSLLFELVNAYFVTLTIKKPSDKWTSILNMIIVICVVAVIIAFMAIMVFGLKV